MSPSKGSQDWVAQLKRGCTSTADSIQRDPHRNRCTSALPRTVTSGPVMRFKAVCMNGDPPSGLQGSSPESLRAVFPPFQFKKPTVVGLVSFRETTTSTVTVHRRG